MADDTEKTINVSQLIEALKVIQKECDEISSRPDETEELKRWIRGYKSGAERVVMDTMKAAKASVRIPVTGK